MDKQARTSANVIDHRHAATHGIAALVALIVGMAIGHRPPAPADHDADLVAVTSTALDRGDDFWSAHLDPEVWRMPHVVLVASTGERTPCGPANSRSGPFYCPPNERIYLDVAFLRAISGDLARAYVTAHELGHHIQKLRHEFDGRSSVAVELGADCYAGMWMHDEQLAGHLAPGDIDKALAEAAAVGDDRLCPGCSAESWTHGSGAQRVAAVRAGLEGGCDAWRYAR